MTRFERGERVRGTRGNNRHRHRSQVIASSTYLTQDPQECSGMQKGWYTIDIFAFDDDKSGTILGDVATFGKVVVYDRANKRAGFKDLADGASCP